MEYQTELTYLIVENIKFSTIGGAHNAHAFLYLANNKTVVINYLASSEKNYLHAFLFFEILQNAHAFCLHTVWPDWAIYWTLGKFLKPLATINLPKSLTFLGNFCKGVKVYHFSSAVIFGQLL